MICKKCGESKQPEDYYKLNPYKCKACCIEYMKARYYLKVGPNRRPVGRPNNPNTKPKERKPPRKLHQPEYLKYILEMYKIHGSYRALAKAVNGNLNSLCRYVHRAKELNL